MEKLPSVISTEEIKTLNEFLKTHEQRLEESLKTRYARIKKKVEEMSYSKLHKIQCLDLRQGASHLEMEASGDLMNWNGFVCGGATATIIDIAMGAALETLINFEEEMIATIDLRIDYLAPAHIGKIMCAKASWTEISSINGDKIPIIKVPEGNKKVVRATAVVVEKPDGIKLAEGQSWYVIFGKKPRK